MSLHLRSLPDLPQHHRRRLPGNPATRFVRKSHWNSTRYLPAPRSSIGQSLENGTSETPGSRTQKARRLSTSGDRTFTSSITVFRSIAKYCLKSCGNIFIALPTGPTGFPIAPPTTRKTGDSAWRTTSSRGLEDGEYEVCIESRLEEGSVTYGEYLIPGKCADEILLSCHACHPSLCNDNLSGIALVVLLARLLSNVDLKYSYRFLLIPGTIGSITWLALNEDKLSRIRHGLVVACVGDPGKFHYKKSRRGDAEIDRAATQALRHHGGEFEILDFSPYGYDERQYCSPGINLPVGSLTRTPHGRFPEYHTSADNLNFVRPEALAGSLAVYLSVIRILENNARYMNLNPKCEPQLGKRGLYRAIGGLADAGRAEMAMLWVLNLSDGGHSLLDIAERAALPFELVLSATRTLVEHGLLEESRG